MTWLRRATRCSRTCGTDLRLNLYLLYQQRKPGNAATRTGRGTPQSLASWLWPLLSPLVIQNLHPNCVFICVPAYLCPHVPHSHLFDLAIKMPVRHVPLGSASVFAKDGHLYIKHNNHSLHTTTFTSPTHPLASLQYGLGCTLLPSQHPTTHSLLISPTPCQRELRDIIIVFVTCRSMMQYARERCVQRPGTPPYPSCSILVLCLLS